MAHLDRKVLKDLKVILEVKVLQVLKDHKESKGHQVHKELQEETVSIEIFFCIKIENN
jgi:hypothetical protein